MSFQRSLGIMIATPGRSSLYRTLHSIDYQQAHIEDVLIVGDGFHQPTADLVETMGRPYRYIATEKTRDWGHSQLNYALQHVRGDYICYQDDDDIFLPRSLTEMETLVGEFETPKMLIGRVKTPRLGLLWQVPGVETCLDGHCVVVPNDKRKLGWFDPGYNGDQCYIHTCMRNFKEAAWADRVWTLTRPQWRLWPENVDISNGKWCVDFHRGEMGVASPKRVASLDFVLDKDRYWSYITPDVTLSIDELKEITEFMMWACQGKDCWIKINPTDGLLEHALIECKFKEHRRTEEFIEYTHDWPPDFWGTDKRYTHLTTEDGKPIQDWRDPWPGRIID